MRDRTFIFAGGGTGGHLYPGIAIARRLVSIEPRTTCLFLCSRRPIDEQVLEPEGFAYTALRASPPGLRPGPLARFLLGWRPQIDLARLIDSAWNYQRDDDDPRTVWYPG